MTVCEGGGQFGPRTQERLLGEQKVIARPAALSEFFTFDAPAFLSLGNGPAGGPDARLGRGKIERGTFEFGQRPSLSLLLALSKLPKLRQRLSLLRPQHAAFVERDAKVEEQPRVFLGNSVAYSRHAAIVAPEPYPGA